MAAFDDSYDVHDKCVAMGLDPDRVSHLACARAELVREANERYELANPMTPERAEREEKARESNRKISAGVGELFKARYSAYAPKAES